MANLPKISDQLSAGEKVLTCFKDNLTIQTKQAETTIDIWYFYYLNPLCIEN